MVYFNMLLRNVTFVDVAIDVIGIYRFAHRGIKLRIH